MAIGIFGVSGFDVRLVKSYKFWDRPLLGKVHRHYRALEILAYDKEGFFHAVREQTYLYCIRSRGVNAEQIGKDRLGILGKKYGGMISVGEHLEGRISRIGVHVYPPGGGNAGRNICLLYTSRCV